MFARPDIPPLRRIFTDGALIGAALLLALFTVVANKPPPATAWPPGGTGAMRLEVARDPLDPAAERNLALALDLSRSPGGAERLMTFAASRSRRDTPTENWLLVRRVSQGRYDDALRSADALLRRDIDEGQRERLVTLLVAAAHYDASRPALIARLSPSPWWRLAFMRELAAHGSPTDTEMVFAGLSRSTGPVTDLELTPLLERLVSVWAYRAAERDWLAFANPRRDPDHIDDFAAPPPFGWSAVFGEGGSSGIDNGVLRIEYDGFAKPQLPRRLLALTPGPYRLSWREAREGDPRMGVEVLCAGTAQVLASARPGTGGRDEARSLDFTVTPADCQGQWLAIVAEPGERHSPVSGAFSDWELTALRLR